MRLRNPGGAGKALETVRLVRQELGNASVQGNNAGERKDAFLTWCDNWASPQLGNHFPATEELFGEIAESYNRLVMLPPMSERQLNGLLHRECRAWDGRLERLEAELTELMRFLARPGRLVVLDTSALSGPGASQGEMPGASVPGPARAGRDETVPDSNPRRAVLLSAVPRDSHPLVHACPPGPAR